MAQSTHRASTSPYVPRELHAVTTSLRRIQDHGFNDPDFNQVVQAATNLQNLGSQALGVQLSQFIGMRDSWLAIQNRARGRIVGPLSLSEMARAQEATTWVAEVEMPLAYWSAFESQMPASVQKTLEGLSLGAASYTAEQLVMATDEWLSLAHMNLGVGFGKVYYL